MTRDELLAKLNSIEWNDIEFKEANWEVPKSSLSTVSAFANTAGGHLVFGVKEENNTFTISGVIEADRIQNAFLGQLRDSNKISVFLPVTGTPHTFPEGTVLIFFIPEASRQDKPVFIDGNPRKAYVRRGSRDDTCTGDELVRFIRDSATDRYDAEPLDLDLQRCFDEASVRWYRGRFNASKPGRDEADDDPTFLHKWGFLVERSGRLLPTRAAILILGADAYVRQVLPRMVVDLQMYRHRAEEYSPSVRWADRLTVEENLVKAWQGVVDFYFKHSERPFSVDAATLRRSDDPPGYIAFREAAINLLIHQDFGDHTRLPVIRIFQDCTEYYNPGDAFASREQLLDPGDKEVRNPSIVRAFRRIGLSDQGGTGVGAIFDGWRRLGYTPPEIENDKAEKSFRLLLRKEPLMTEEQLLAQASLGVHLNEQEAAVFAYLTSKGHLDLTDIKGLTGLNGAHARALAQRLSVQVLLEPVGETGTQFTLASHLRSRFTPLPETQPAELTGNIATVQVSDQVPESSGQLSQSLDHLSDLQWTIVESADVPRSLAELMDRAGYRHRSFFQSKHLKPLLAGRILRRTIPDKPNSSDQKYVLTEMGIKLKEWRHQNRTTPEQTGDQP
ncbi:MAG: RNA-binding domain-containing protein [Desulfuromonadales bacterium]